MQPLLHDTFAQSWLAGPGTAGTRIICAQWRVDPEERYTGAFFNVETANPIPFIGNTYEPGNALVSAKDASVRFKDSLVLQNNGAGVSHLASTKAICF